MNFFTFSDFEEMESTSSVLVREATTSDYDDFIKVFSVVEQLHRENLSWKFKKPEVLFERGDYDKMINDDSVKFYLAYIGESIAGMLMAYVRTNKKIPMLQDRIYVDIDAICVLEDYRNKGVGKNLLFEVENWAKNNNILDIQLNVREFNKNAKNFYLNNGFETVSSIMRKVL